MVANLIFEIFMTLFPTFGEHATMWFPNGKNGIRVRIDDGHEFIFTYDGKDDWSLETIGRYVKKTKGGAKMR